MAAKRHLESMELKNQQLLGSLRPFYDQERVFSGIAAAKDEVVAAGEKAPVCLYNGGSGEF